MMTSEMWVLSPKSNPSPWPLVTANAWKLCSGTQNGGILFFHCFFFFFTPLWAASSESHCQGLLTRCPLVHLAYLMHWSTNRGQACSGRPSANCVMEDRPMAQLSCRGKEPRQPRCQWLLMDDNNVGDLLNKDDSSAVMQQSAWFVWGRVGSLGFSDPHSR